MSSQPKNVTTTSTKELPKEFQGLLSQYTDQLANTSVTQAPLTYGQQQSLTSLSAAGQAGQANLEEAMGLLRGTANGNYVGANPYIDAQIAKAQGDITSQFRDATAPSIDASAARAGIFGGSAWQNQLQKAQQVLGGALGDVSSQMRGQAYTTERAQQEAATRDMLNSSDAGIKFQQGLFGAYEPERMAQQAQMDEDQRKLALLSQAIGLGYTGASTSQTAPNPSYASPFQQLLGAGLTVGGLMTGNPLATKAGTGLL